jgi:hypothetical protein
MSRFLDIEVTLGGHLRGACRPFRPSTRTRLAFNALELQLSYAPDDGLAEEFRLWPRAGELIGSSVKVRYAEAGDIILNQME